MAPGIPDVQESPGGRIQTFLDNACSKPDSSSFEIYCMKQVKLTKAEVGIAEFEFTVTQQMCNPLGILHGGCASTILDVLTSTATFTAPDSDGAISSLSRTLSVTFLRPVPLDTTVRVVVKLVAVGKKYVNCTGEIQTLDGKVCVTCVHDKAIWRIAKI
ncbi:hypothetical protein AJ79_09759 [Helicocarpus griseus UAMH5409]|uniref:Thioesterase domain-containing protein n=1 Tax=Helicocarpus griseus UAMH5409 TaxID=1447875 RepID=A0A2B7WHJ2_9EURO|nr:hypothetical protein AJ79_09759 [Helicocarpus griseus UAMH5409]